MTIALDALPGVTPTDGRWNAGSAVVYWRYGTLAAGEVPSVEARRWLQQIVQANDLFTWRGLRTDAPWQKPRLVDAPGSDASISHSGRSVLVAVTVGGAAAGAGAAAAGVRVGADVESAPFTAFAAESLRRRMCAPDELLHLAALDGADRPRWLASLWTAKEALTKASGHGTALDFRTLSLDPVLSAPRTHPEAHLAILDDAVPMLARLVITDSAVTLAPDSTRVLAVSRELSTPV